MSEPIISEILSRYMHSIRGRKTTPIPIGRLRLHSQASTKSTPEGRKKLQFGLETVYISLSRSGTARIPLVSLTENRDVVTCEVSCALVFHNAYEEHKALLRENLSSILNAIPT